MPELRAGLPPSGKKYHASSAFIPPPRKSQGPSQLASHRKLCWRACVSKHKRPPPGTVMVPKIPRRMNILVWKAESWRPCLSLMIEPA